MSYLGNLTLRLAAGSARLGDAFRRRQADFFCGRQAPDGGFSGREGPGDLYYTGFALRGLALADHLDEPVARRAARFLQDRLGRTMPGIDLFSLVYSAVVLDLSWEIDVFAAAGLDPAAVVAEALAPLERGDGGYAKTVTSGHSSTYHTFLAVSCLQLVGKEAEALVTHLRAQNRPFILLGDFNDTPGSRTVELFRSIANEVPTRDDARFTYPSKQPAREIDFIWCAPPHAWTIHHARVVPEAAASDHRPVVADLTLRRDAD